MSAPPPAEPPAVPARSGLRASDADRERVAEILREALVEGRLRLSEFESRLEEAQAARTYGELEHLVHDLPVGVEQTATYQELVPQAPAAVSPRIGGRPTSGTGIAILGGFERKGVWTIAQRFTSFALLGGGTIDLREANFEAPETVIRCVALLGGITVIVSPEVDLEVRGIGVMGGFEQGASGIGEAGAPRVVVTGFSFWGGVGVQRKVTKAERRRLKAERKERRQLEKQREDNS